MLAQLIRMRRAELDITQPDLAKATNTSQATISRIEKGVVCPDARLLVFLARALQLPPIRLLEAVEAELPTAA